MQSSRFDQIAFFDIASTSPAISAGTTLETTEMMPFPPIANSGKRKNVIAG